MRIAVNGMGRIGRLCIRIALSRNAPGFEIGVLNSTSPTSVLAHLLAYDTVHGKWDADIRSEPDRLIVSGHEIPVISERDPAQLPWQSFGIDLVIDATGKFRDRVSLEKHLKAGAGKVLLTAPGKDLDATIVLGVNEERYDPKRHRLVSAASCTTNCLAPVLKILDGAFGVKRGWLTSIHAYTNDQNHMDNPHKDLRRARACTQSIIPTTTGVSKALVDVLPRLAPHLKGVSVRVPTPDVSLLDLLVFLNRSVEPADVANAFQAAIAEGMGAYVAYNELPLVSSDYIGSDKSAVIDGLSIMTDGDSLKLMAWYDNEWGYASRLIDLAAYMSQAEFQIRKGGDTCLVPTV
ncbi:type I glyceraldehyde-3-phosphate dehydrogenase [Cohnella sp. CFH 77786]|uniref:type I glyceraldehyde-3-phosphate dehydrogenase n=1 Tax=Cohnella sp. CFH 77786 TaxID=2662265 RepID=UPI001C60E67A|nr:type I glyceraldehyde-3-phosphate dehydrogenase [Cohnella sp. CFH 77786]MBW5445300.1 type I glyceraldehyde-3-phosphate dehydrogenase [Cohnella sp. CFH 77786]